MGTFDDRDDEAENERAPTSRREFAARVIPIAGRQQTARTCKNCLWWSAPYQGDPSQCLGGITEGAITHPPPLASYPHTAASETCRGWEANK